MLYFAPGRIELPSGVRSINGLGSGNFRRLEICAGNSVLIEAVNDASSRGGLIAHTPGQIPRICMDNPGKAWGFEIDALFRIAAFVPKKRGERKGCQYEKERRTLLE